MSKNTFPSVPTSMRQTFSPRLQLSPVFRQTSLPEMMAITQNSESLRRSCIPHLRNMGRR
jgi:hypothetical protein